MDVLVVLVAGFVLVFTVAGFRIGLVRRLLEFVGVVLSFWLATALAARVSEWLARVTDVQERLALTIGWVVLFIGGLVLTRLVARMLSKAIQISVIGWLDRLGGALFGLLLGMVLASVVLIALARLPGGGSLQEAYLERPVTSIVYRTAPTLYDALQRLGGDRTRLWQEIRRRLETGVAAAADEVSAVSGARNDYRPAGPSCRA
jgi:membrane protein required for colicin V production